MPEQPESMRHLPSPHQEKGAHPLEDATEHQPLPDKGWDTLLVWRPTPSLPKTNLNSAMPCWEAGLAALTGRARTFSPTTGCSLCSTACRARASSQVPPEVTVRDSDPGALTPRTVIPLGAHSANLPSSPSNPPKPHTYSQHLQSLYPADPSRSCKPFSHGRMSPERRKALTCLQFASPEQAGRGAAE